MVPAGAHAAGGDALRLGRVLLARGDQLVAFRVQRFFHIGRWHEAVDRAGGIDAVFGEDGFQHGQAVGKDPHLAGQREEGFAQLIDLVGAESASCGGVAGDRVFGVARHAGLRPWMR